MTVTAIIQARMGSSRLPGKILKEVNGKSLLLHQINRLRLCKEIDQIVIATTTEKIDHQIVTFCEKNNVLFYRGSEQDVLDRYYRAWEQYGGDTVVRLTSDCPLIDPETVDEILTFFKANQFDYVSNTIDRTYPRGLDTEVFTREVLETIHEKAYLERDREHVTAYIYTNPNQFNIGSFIGKEDYSKYRWTVDTEEDFQLIKNIFEAFTGKEEQLILSNIVKVMEENSEWIHLNDFIEQKKI